MVQCYIAEFECVNSGILRVKLYVVHSWVVICTVLYDLIEREDRERERAWSALGKVFKKVGGGDKL